MVAALAAVGIAALGVAAVAVPVDCRSILMACLDAAGAAGIGVGDFGAPRIVAAGIAAVFFALAAWRAAPMLPDR